MTTQPVAGGRIERALRKISWEAEIFSAGMVADLMYRQLGKRTQNHEIGILAEDFEQHENAMRDWFRSELRGKSDGGEKIFAYLQRHGIGRADAGTAR